MKNHHLKNSLIGIILLGMLLSVSSIDAQQRRILVNEHGDVIPLSNGASARQTIEKYQHARQTSGNQEKRTYTCDPIRTFGDSPSYLESEGYNSLDAGFIFGHKDVIGNWYPAPATGTLDSIFIDISPYSGDSTSMFPHRLYVRIFESNVDTGHGPGWGGYVAPPRVCWGYYNSVWDADNGIAAFARDSPESTWISTYNHNNDIYILNGSSWSGIGDHYGQIADTMMQSFTPDGDIIWGESGFPMSNLHKGINFLDLGTFEGRPVLQKGEPFFITLTNPSVHPYGYIDESTDPGRVVVMASSYGTLGGDPQWGLGSNDTSIRRNFHGWKFYEHMMHCGPGWIAMGGSAYDLWFVMTSTSDEPPTIVSVEKLGHTFMKNVPRTVHAEIKDCNFENPAQAGVGHAELRYSVNGGAEQVITMGTSGSDIFTGSIPGQASSSSVTYYITATDVMGNTSMSGNHVYRTLSLETAWYIADTGSVRTAGSISPAHGGSGMPIDTSQFFLPVGTMNPPAPSGAYMDDGTAGPFHLAPPATFFSESFAYAWVGVNGAIGLSKTASDTMHINSNGFYKHWIIPDVQRRPGTSNSDTSLKGVPRNFLGVMWADLIYGDSYGNEYGAIYYKDSPTSFIVEWDSIGVYGLFGASPDELTFRIVLNKLDGSIELQYDDVGINGMDSTCTIAVESDSSNPSEAHGFLLLNDYGYPRETVPRNNWCIKLVPPLPIAVADGWNMLSYPGIPSDNHKSVLFTDAVSDAFAYTGRYSQDSLIQPGKGYWLKYLSSGTVVCGNRAQSLEIPLRQRWNMIGSIGAEVSVGSLTTTPSNLIKSLYWWYDGSTYSPASAIEPGRAYWVKSDDAGTLHMAPAGAGYKIQSENDRSGLESMDRLTFRSGRAMQTLYFGNGGQFLRPLSYYELPPLPPSAEVEGFDARFSTGRMGEEYPDDVTKTSLAIDLTTGKHGPVNISWTMQGDSALPAGYCFILTDEEKTIGEVALRGTGTITLEGTAPPRLLVKAVPASSIIPREYALSQNYPNPFNPSTSFRIDVPKTGHVTLTIYDLLGRRIALLAEGEQAPGTRVVHWDGMNSMELPVPSGAYFVRMTAEGFTAIKKILLMR